MASSKEDTKARDIAVIKHTIWKAAHEAGQTSNGRLLMRGGRHKDKRREADRLRCRGKPDDV